MTEDKTYLLAGKVVDRAEKDDFDDGFTIYFTDGSYLHVGSIRDGGCYIELRDTENNIIYL